MIDAKKMPSNHFAFCSLFELLYYYLLFLQKLFPNTDCQRLPNRFHLSFTTKNL